MQSDKGELNDYLDTRYQGKPFTAYPEKLTRYLTNRFAINRGSRILDIGCGRGEFLQGFIMQGMEGFGIDQASRAREHCPTATLVIGDIEKELPFESDFFDVVYNKSVVEHFHFPEKILSEIHRVLKPNGRIITMTPDWNFNMDCFYDDFTHKSPFSRQSIGDIHRFCGFREVQSERFIQLPQVWESSVLMPLVSISRRCLPSSLKRHSKFVRFSKEVMLLATGRK